MNTPVMPASPAPMALRCPKCAAEMATYERSGIHVDQCRECRGIYLDRGELERLIDAESNGAGWAGPTMSPPAPIPLPRARDPRTDPGSPSRGAYRSEWLDDHDDHGDQGRRDRDADWDERRSRESRERPPQRRRSFLGELLEGLGD